ncbi:MAG: HPr family phosphocarrier protein [Planctomycetota bacterium]
MNFHKDTRRKAFMSTIQRRLYTVNNPNGLHMRPLQAFVEQASRFQSNIQVGRKDGELLNGKSMIHLLGLGADQGTEIVIEVSGPDADTAIEALWEVLQKIYEED